VLQVERTTLADNLAKRDQDIARSSAEVRTLGGPLKAPRAQHLAHGGFLCAVAGGLDN